MKINILLIPENKPKKCSLFFKKKLKSAEECDSEKGEKVSYLNHTSLWKAVHDF